MNRPVLLLLLAVLAAVPVRAAGHDECDAGFIAFLAWLVPSNFLPLHRTPL